VNEARPNPLTIANRLNFKDATSLGNLVKRVVDSLQESEDLFTKDNKQSEQSFIKAGHSLGSGSKLT